MHLVWRSAVSAERAAGVFEYVYAKGKRRDAASTPEESERSKKRNANMPWRSLSIETEKERLSGERREERRVWVEERGREKRRMRGGVIIIIIIKIRIIMCFLKVFITFMKRIRM